MLNGKVALVTGGGRGIGRAVALDLAGRGVKVAVSARNVSELQEVTEAIAKLGQVAFAFPTDLMQGGSTAEALVEAVTSQLGPIDILINNAAVAGPFGLSWEVAPDGWAAAIEVNLVAPFRLARAVLPHMREQGWGRIINVSSGAARNPMERAGAYSTTKAGLDMLSRQLGIELADSGVSVVSVYPGVVDTAMQTNIREHPAEVIGEAMSKRFNDFYTQGQLQPPERPARLIANLADEAGANYNGQIVDIYDQAHQDLIK